MERDLPSDRFSLVFLSFVLYGIGTLMPWHMFITAKSYFSDYKLGESYIGKVTPLATNFIAYVGITSQLPSLLFNWINLFTTMKASFTLRIVCSLIVELIIFIVTVILAMADTSHMYVAFFWITMVTVVILNIAGGIFQNTAYGMAAKLPFKYSGAVVLGANISGTFTSIVSVLSINFSSSSRTAAIYYFITALLIIFLCFDLYFALPLNKFYRYYELQTVKSQEVKAKITPYWKIFKQTFPQQFNLFILFWVTLAIFPQINSDIKKSNPNFFIDDKNYAVIMCFLTFNTCAVVGSLIASFIQWPKAQYLIWTVLIRIVLIPLFLLCKYEPAGINRIMPIYITNDGIFWLLTVVLGLSSGYLSSIIMMYAPKLADPEYFSTAGMLSAAVLISGIVTGLVSSMIWPYVVANISW